MSSSAARAAVRREVATPVKSRPRATRAPDSRMTALAVVPVPRPTSMPGPTRLAAATASLCRRSSRSTSARSRVETRGRVLVDEPGESAVLRTNQLRRQMFRIFGSLLNGSQRLRLAWPCHQEEDFARGIERRDRQGQPLGVELGYVIGDSEPIFFQPRLGCVGRARPCVRRRPCRAAPDRTAARRSVCRRRCATTTS